MNRIHIVALGFLIFGVSVYLLFVPKYLCIDVVSGHGYDLSYSAVEMCAPSIEESKSREHIGAFLSEVKGATVEELSVLFSGDKNAGRMGYGKFREIFTPTVQSYLNLPFYFAFQLGSNTIHVYMQKEQNIAVIFDESNDDQRVYTNKVKLEALNPLLSSVALRSVEITEFHDFGYPLNSLIGDRQWLGKGFLRYSEDSKTIINPREVNTPPISFVNAFLSKASKGALSESDFMVKNDYDVLGHMLANDRSERELWSSIAIEKMVFDKRHFVVFLDSQKGKRVLQVIHQSNGYKVFGLHQMTTLEALYRNGYLQ